MGYFGYANDPLLDLMMEVITLKKVLFCGGSATDKNTLKPLAKIPFCKKDCARTFPYLGKEFIDRLSCADAETVALIARLFVAYSEY